ncbi:MAG: hypothetical protein EBU88_10890, partial [Acidobacteria bacterium]|nr:hypothetical protein [Acidobacteriota bacterium]
KKYLPKIADGSLRLQAFGVTEPTSGTDTLALKTTATRDGDYYIVKGQKIWTSRAAQSDLMLLLARTTPRDKVAKKTDGLSVFLIDLKSLVAMLVQTDRFGTSIADSLRVFSDSMRTKRRQRAEEMVAKAAIKLIFPLLLFIFPALLIVLMGPALIKLPDLLGVSGE